MKTPHRSPTSDAAEARELGYVEWTGRPGHWRLSDADLIRLVAEGNHFVARAELAVALQDALDREASWAKVAREYESALSDRGLL